LVPVWYPSGEPRSRSSTPRRGAHWWCCFSHGNLSLILVGNLGTQVIQGLVLGPCLHAFGKDEHLSQMVLINTLVMLFAGLMPVHGGVAEAGYVAYLQTIGILSAVAMSTALLYRLVTVYLPPIWGSFAMGD
jgi:Lysylphosphatidylglycerol synthase TM region